MVNLCGFLSVVPHTRGVVDPSLAYFRFHRNLKPLRRLPSPDDTTSTPLVYCCLAWLPRIWEPGSRIPRAGRCFSTSSREEAPTSAGTAAVRDGIVRIVLELPTISRMSSDNRCSPSRGVEVVLDFWGARPRHSGSLYKDFESPVIFPSHPKSPKDRIIFH